jgi:hypothetical protein
MVAGIAYDLGGQALGRRGDPSQGLSRNRGTLVSQFLSYANYFAEERGH